jgi:zinc protease
MARRTRIRGIASVFAFIAAAITYSAALGVGAVPDSTRSRDQAVRGAVVPALALPLRDSSSSSANDTLRDPSLTIGTLPNGLRYYLRANGMPAHRVELRLAVNAGSLLEDEDQRGYAHFLEHMAFNGTTHFPHGDLVDFIETSGMRFGADLNAFTSQDETVYMLTLPTDDRKILDRGLTVLRDWAGGGITIDTNEVKAERGVVMGEWRMRLLDTASQRFKVHMDTVLYGDSRYPLREPIGDTTLVENATAAPIRRFYDKWYRPDNMAIVVVGDFDRVAMEREIKSRFGSIPAGAKTGARPTTTLPKSATPVVDVFKGNVIPQVEVLWPAPAVPAHTRDAVAQGMVLDLISHSVEQRLLRIREHPSRPYITADLEQGRLVRPLEVVGAQVIAFPDSLERSLGTVLTEFERVAQHGIPEPALAHEKAVLLGHLEHAAAGAGGHASQAYADGYVENFLTAEKPLLSAQQELTLAREILPSITPELIAKAAQRWREPSGMRVLFALPEFSHVRPPTRESVLAIIDSVKHTAIPSDSAVESKPAPLLATLPTPGRIVAEKLDRVAGITEWTLSNGAHVIVKPSQNDPDDLQMRAWSPGGFAAMPDSLFNTPGRMVARVMTDVGGIGGTSHDALSHQLETTGLRSMVIDIGYADESIKLEGTPKDLETIFQLMHLQFTAPLLDTVALAGWQSLAKFQGSPFSLNDQMSITVARGNMRMMPVSTSLAELATVKQLTDAYHDRFGNAGDFTFTLVGAMTPKELRPLVERYLASLPSTDVREHPVPTENHSFLHKISTNFPTLQQPKSQTLLVFDGPFPDSAAVYLREREKLSALTGIVNDRMRVRLREQLAGTYSPYVTSGTLAMPEERYRFLVAFDAAPERMHDLNHEMMNVLDSLRTRGVTTAEAARAATVQTRQLQTRLQDNDYWMTTIGDYARLGIPLDKIPSPYPERVLSSSELMSAAKRYLPSDAYIHLTAMPEDSTSYAKHDAAP